MCIRDRTDSLLTLYCRYLSDKKELLTYLYSLHLKNVTPHVIIIDDLGNYYGEDNFEQALISASVLESIRYCGDKHKGGPVYLSTGVCTMKKESISLLQMFFSNIWRCNNEGTLLTQQSNFMDNSSHEFEFAKIGDNGDLKLERILKIHHPP